MTLAITTTTHEITTGAASLEEMLAAFAEWLDVKPVTRDSYGVCLRAFLDWTTDNGITKPTREDVLAYVKYLASPAPPQDQEREAWQRGYVLCRHTGPLPSPC